MTESGTVKKISGWTFVSGDKPIRVCLCHIVFYYIGTKIYVVVNFLSQVIFVFLLFFGMVMYANEVETKEK